ncbi:ketoreductase domain-containing protein [Streptomyces sp. M19]
MAGRPWCRAPAAGQPQRARGPGAARLREELAAAGADVTLAACDVADRDALAALLAGIPAEQPLTAVVHTAAVLDDGVLDALSPERADRVLRPKMVAAAHLHELTRHLELDAFVLFSSIGGTLGVSGHGNYAPGNAFLDALAERAAPRGSSRPRSPGAPGPKAAWPPGAW